MKICDDTRRIRFQTYEHRASRREQYYLAGLLMHIIVTLADPEEEGGVRSGRSLSQK